MCTSYDYTNVAANICYIYYCYSKYEYVGKKWLSTKALILWPKMNTTNYPTITNTALALTVRKPVSVCAIQPTGCSKKARGNIMCFEFLCWNFYKCFIYYTKFKNCLLSFLTFVVFCWFIKCYKLWVDDRSDSKIKIIREKLDKGYLCVVSLQAEIRKNNDTLSVISYKLIASSFLNLFFLNHSIYVYKFF